MLFFFFLLHSFASIFLLLFSSVLVQILVSDGDALFFFSSFHLHPFLVDLNCIVRFLFLFRCLLWLVDCQGDSCID